MYDVRELQGIKSLSWAISIRLPMAPSLEKVNHSQVSVGAPQFSLCREERLRVVTCEGPSTFDSDDALHTFDSYCADEQDDSAVEEDEYDRRVIII
mmetsp:Transcript_11010/g.14537  ORF Transcript_11010/g.14537 Transcript_11010/m.14537 type:complete len:96 (-) Transcript_11010:748-1035(-)